MKADELHFVALKEARDWYFVEYTPPITTNPFAIVQLTILNDTDATNHARIASAMEEELSRWLRRYDVPVMLFAFKAVGDLICLEPHKLSNHLMGRNSEPGKVESVWGSLNSESLRVFSPEELRTIYHDISFRTGQEIALENEQEQKKIMTGLKVWRFLFILWLVVIPAGIAFLGFANPIVGIMALAYSLWMAGIQLLKLLGKWPKSKWETAKEKEDQDKEHHHYHCKRNPEGFMRLKFENFDREEREKTLREAEELKNAKT